MEKRSLVHWVLLACVGMAGQAALGGVTFNNVDGAFAWTWVEAEGYSASSGFNNTWDSSSSGWPVAWSTDSAIYTLYKGDYGTYVVSVPVAMTTAYLYARATGSYDDPYRAVSVRLGDITGTVLGSYENRSGGMRLQGQCSLTGGLSSGDVTLTLEHSGEYDYNITDGFFVTNSAITDNGLTIVGDYYVEQAPAFLDALPVISGDAFTPTVSNAPAGATYWCNGVMDYWAFPLIDTPGDYELVVKDYQGRVISGVSFAYVPEPATLGLMLISAAAFVLRKK